MVQKSSPALCKISATGKDLAAQVVDEIEDDLLDVGVRYAQAWI